MKYIIGFVIIVVIGTFFLFRDGTENTADDINNDQNPAITAETPATGNEEGISGVDEMAVEDEKTTDGSADVTAELSDEVPADIKNAILVKYTDGGFGPSAITITSGQTVRFVNESSGNMWVASAFHPTHEILPAFDQKKGVGNGESYQFTFTKTGTWKYHDHLNPSAFGTIIVE